MNNQSSPMKVFAIIALLVVALVAVYFSLNKTINIAPQNLAPTGTSTTSYTTNNNSTTSNNNVPPTEVPKDGKPVIKKLDIPTFLNTDQTGTWTIYASSTDGGVLTYSVVWGDEVGVANSSVTKNTTFTHSYAYPGVYNPVFTIHAINGQSVYASVGVTIRGEITKAPIIYSLSPSSAAVGTLVTINGAGFTGPDAVPNGPGTVPSNQVLFDGVALGGVTSNGVNSLYFIVPDTAKAGKHIVQVKNHKGSSNSVSITVTK